MIIKHRRGIIIIILIIICGFSINNYGYCDRVPQKHILILNSYHIGDPWTDNLVSGIEDGFLDVGTQFDIHKEYMDSENVSHEAYQKTIFNLFKYKYENHDFDIIIANDEYAYRFLMEYRQDLFGDISVVVCGLNQQDNSIYSESNSFVGVEKNIDIKGTIDLALDLHKQIENIYVVLDHSLMGSFVMEKTMKTIPKYNDKIKFYFIQETYIQKVFDKLKDLSQNSIILQTGIFADEYSEQITIERGNEIISKAADVPVYVLSDVFVTDGVVGGKVSNSYNIGKIAAEKALEILEGTRLDSRQMSEVISSQFMFNYNEIRNNGISTIQLPKDSVFIKEPATYINVSKQKIYLSYVVIIAILAITNSILFFNYLKRKRTEKELIREKNILQAVLDCTMDGILVVDNEDNLVLNANYQFKNMWRIPEVAFDAMYDNRLVKFVKDQLLDPEGFEERILEINQKGNQFSDTLNFKDGRVFERSCTPLLIKGKLKGRVWSFRDITKRVEFESELRKSEELYRKLVELLPDAVLVRKEKEVIIANEAVFKLMDEKRPDRLKEGHINEIFKVTEDYLDIVNQRVKELLSNETTVGFLEQKVVLKNGDVIDVEAGSSSFRHGEGRYIVSVIRDIRERKKAEDLQKKIIEKNLLLKEVREYDRLKTEFFSTISHELKTPLNIILGGLQLMISSQGDSLDCEYYLKFMKYIHMMKQNCYRLLRLINNLIDITRIDSGYMQINLENHDIVKVIEDITQSVCQYINDNGIELVFDTDVEEKCIACDAEKLERVMLNLLSNAVKFTDTGGKIEVNITNQGNVAIISVKDTGIGIPEEMRSEIFERFRQVDSSLRRKKEGSGIGLSLVKSIVELHGGEIQVKSEVGKGSEFILKFPVNYCEDIEVTKQEVAAATPANVERIQVEFSDIYS